VLSLRFLLAVAVSIAVILSAPFIRDIRDWIRGTFPGQYATVVGTAVALAIGAAIVVALVRIRDRRALRYGAIAAALAFGTLYALWNAQGIAEVDAVERVHFVEYGAIALLFYRVWRPRGDASMFVLPMLAGIAVGTLEEWLQWFIPGRVGDMRDVFLNMAAIVCGLLFSVGVDPPDARPLTLRPGSLRRIGVVAAAVALLFGVFVRSVHFGVETNDPEAGRFRSRYDAATLLRIGQDRLVLWKDHPPIERPRSRSREDQYMSEGLLHVQERNRRWEAGDIRAAWSENLILEKYYAPVLDTPSYISRTGHRWPAGQRADAEQRLGGAASGTARSYESRADAAEGRHFIRIWSPVAFWIVVTLGVCSVLALCFALDRRRADG
jgi:VanZ family protein